MIARLFEAGADVFRINMSHTSHDRMRELVAAIRASKQDSGRPIGILVDLQGPKLRVGTFAGGSAMLAKGATLRARRRSGAGRRHARAPAASGNLRRARARPHAAARRRQGAAHVTRGRAQAHRHARRGRRQAVRPQGREPARHDDSVLRADRRRTAPISKPRSMPASTGSRSPSSSGRRTSPRPRRSRAAAPP